MSMFSAGFKMFADITDFEKNMAKAMNSAKDVGKKVSSAFDGKAIGRTLATALGLSLQSIAEKVARFWTGFSTDAEDALEAMVAATGKSADAQERALEKLRAKKQKEKEDAMKDAEDEAEYFQKLQDKFRKEREQEATKEKNARKEAATDLAAFEAKKAFEKLSTQEKINTLKREEKNLATIIKDVEDGARKGIKQTEAGQENLIVAKQRHAEIQGQIKDLTDKTIVSEKENFQLVTNQYGVEISVSSEKLNQLGIEGLITKEKSEQLNKEKERLQANAMLNSLLEDQLIVAGKIYGASRDPNSIEQGSDEELKSLIKKTQAEIAMVESNKGRGLSAGADAASGFIIQGAVIDRLRTDIQRAQYQLSVRDNLRTDVSRLGVGGARDRFQGDPLAFDRLLQQYVSDSRSTQELAASTNELLRQINDRQRNGIAVINLNK